MTNETLLALALAAIADEDARVVLADAMQEAEPYFDERMRIHLGHAVYHGWDTHGVRAIAAVLLFGDWPTSWPLAERCRLCPIWPMAHGAVCSCRERVGADKVRRNDRIDS